MAGPTHVYRRGATYWWRRRVPKALVPKFGCPELRFSLRTHIRRDAAHRAARLRLVTDSMFGEVEQVVEGLRLTPQAMKAIVDELVRGELEAAERARAVAPPRTPEEADAAVAATEQARVGAEHALALQRYDLFAAPLEAAVARAGAPIDPRSDDYRLLLRLAGRALIQVHRVNGRRELGVYEEDRDGFAATPLGEARATAAPAALSPAGLMISTCPERAPLGRVRANVPTTGSPVEALTEPAAAPSGGPGVAAAARCVRLSQAAKPLVEEKSKDDSWRSNMRRKYEVSARLFIEAHGDLRLDEYTTAMCEEFRELVKRLPRHHGKSARDHRTVREIVEALDQGEMDRLDALEDEFEAGRIDRKTFDLRRDQCTLARLGPTAVNLHVDRIKAVFDYAIKKKLFAGPNPMVGIRLSKKEQGALRRSLPPVSRLPWGQERIQRLFTSTAFSGGLPVIAGEAFTGDPLFWAPLIAAHMGLREEEILQTQLPDIETMSGVPCWRIRPGPGKKLKTENAERDVPIHSILIEAGFLELIEMLRRRGEIWLFPEIDRGAATGRFTDLFSKRFRRYRDDEGLYDPQRDFHALRKDFNVALREKYVYWAARRRLLGHALDDVTDERYDPEGESIKKRKEYVDLVDHGLRVGRRDGKVVIVIRAPEEDAGR